MRNDAGPDKSPAAHALYPNRRSIVRRRRRAPRGKTVLTVSLPAAELRPLLIVPVQLNIEAAQLNLVGNVACQFAHGPPRAAASD